LLTWLWVAAELSATWRTVVICLLVTANGWLFASLLVSHLVYDRSGVVRGDWLPDGTVRAVATLHFGHDEVSAVVARRLPAASHHRFDLYDPKRSGSPSLRRARAASRGVAPATTAPLDRLPLADGAIDLAVLAFAAHEVRDHTARTALFREAARVVGTHGRVLVLEHLRDGWNLLAYGPGACHFLSRRTWVTTFDAAGLSVVMDSPVTPWVRRFELVRCT
jgi:SAM-dependent methyltransferase